MYNSWGALSTAANSMTDSPSQVNGYTQYGANPYSELLSQGQSLLGSDTKQASSMAQQGNQNLMNQMQSYGQYAQNTEAYPSYPNAAGAGSQNMGVPQYTQSPMIGSGQEGAGVNQNLTNSSQGFNPWSLTGEALSRAK